MKTILLAGAVLLGLMQSAQAYSFGGPIGNGGDSWQTGEIGYGLTGDLNAPKNLGEEYRRNTPVMYYAYDQNFLDYFGSNGVVAVDSTFTVLNNLQNVSSYSTNLSEFPIETRHNNYQAQALGLMDLKSVTLGLMMEQMGLADPVRYSWTLHDRYLPPGGTCPADEEYEVVQRNFDYISSPLNQLQYSPYVNNTLYSYEVLEYCTPVASPEPPMLAYAAPYSADPLADIYAPVASFISGAIYWGDFYTGLTRDDMAGLRYLLHTNNVNWETPDAASLAFTISTNLPLQQLLPNGTGTNNTGTNGNFYYYDGNIGYGDYGALVASSITNSPAVLQALYPGLVIASSTNYFVLATNWTFTQYFTNAGYGQPYPPVLTLVTVSNAHPYLLEKFVTKFANVFPDPGHKGNYSPNTTVKRQTISVVPNTGAPYGSPPLTNITTQTITYTGVPSGDFILLPPFYTNVCPVDILYAGLTNVLAITNVLTGTTTNIVTATNTSVYTSTLIQINYFTNYTFVINPVTCATVAPPTGLYQGIERINFVKSSYDSLLGQYFQPITNNYSLVLVTNSQAQVQHLQRIVTAPDILLSAADLARPLPGGVLYDTRNVNFDTANVLPQLAGPGTITTPTTFTYDKVGPVFYNTPSGTMFGAPYFTATPGTDSPISPATDDFYSVGVYFVWASFDGTTNAPVVFPNGTSIDSLENQVLIQITTTPAGALVGNLSRSFNVRFTATGGAFEPPYTWSGSGLPPGLSVVSNADNTATLSGVAGQTGLFVFTLTLTDSLGRSVQWNYPLTIQ